MNSQNRENSTSRQITRTNPDLQIVDTISDLIKKSKKIVPIFGILSTLFIVFLQIYPQVDWSQIHIEITPGLIVFGAITPIDILIKAYVRFVFKKMGSVQIEPPINFDDSINREELEPEFNDQKFSSEFVTSRDLSGQQLNDGNSNLRETYTQRITELTDLAEEAFPRGKSAGKMSYAKSRDERRDAFRLWTRFNPETAQIIYYNDKPIGMSLMLRLSKDTYIRYKDGKVRSWEIEERDLVNTDEQDTPYLFFQYIYCKESRNKNYNSSKYMCWVFLNHLSIFWRRSGHEPVLIAPRITEMGQVNAKILGFKYCGEDNKFPLYELDLRHPDELNGKSQEVYRVLRQLIE